MKKRLCVLQVTPAEPNPDHVNYFKDKEDCDFYFVTHDAPHPDALEFCPNTTWTDTRNILVNKVPKVYDYYTFADYDYIMRPQGNLSVLDQMLKDLNEFEPAVMTYYPGRGMHTPYSGNEVYRKSKEYSVIPFTHAAFKAVHHSLLDWFFPMITKFGGGFSSCHLFNIFEIPFLEHVVCGHSIIYDNGVSAKETPHNKDSRNSHNKMQEMWRWFMPAFKKMEELDKYTKMNKSHAISIKEAYMNKFKLENVLPQKSNRDVNYLNREKIEEFFDLGHEFFIDKEIF